MLHCGLYAINAILDSIQLCPYRSEDLDAITRWIHCREKQLCPEAADTVPQVEGNYPVETLLVALRKRGLSGQYERPHKERYVLIRRTVVGFLIGTGNHYVAVTRMRGPGGRWRLVDNGRTTDQDPQSPYALIGRMSAKPCAVICITDVRNNVSKSK